jgi:hypothetical protein
VKTSESTTTGQTGALRYLRAALRHLRSNIVAYLALAVAVGSGGSYALAASPSKGTTTVCVDKGSGVMHLAKHPCGRHQTRVGISSALDQPMVSAWATGGPLGGALSASGMSITHAGIGMYDVKVTAARCRHAVNNAPVVSVDDDQPPAGFASQPGAFPVAWAETASSGVEAFTIHTGVVVNGAFQPQDERFNVADSCG